MLTFLRKTMRVGYIRVSSSDQNTGRQLENIALDKMFTDYCSGKDTNRPQFQNMIEFVREGDSLIVHSMDRLARNLDDLRKTVQQLVKKGVRIEFIKEGLVFTGEDSSASVLLLSIMGAIAEFERSFILERQREGIELAKKRGVYRGGTKSLNPEEIRLLKERVASGEKKAVIARDLKISRQTVYSYLKVSPILNKCLQSCTI